jgi:transcriptional antiterminator RfaH
MDSIASLPKIKLLDLKNRRWFAAYTKPRSEKKVYERLVEAGFEAYLPLQKIMKQWSERKKMVEEPLLRSYIFVRVNEKEYHQAIKIMGTVRYVCFEGKGVPIPDRQIETLKMLLKQDFDVQILDEKLALGDRVEITYGAMNGFEGRLVKHKGKDMAIIEIESVSHQICVTLPLGYLAKKIESKG